MPDNLLSRTLKYYWDNESIRIRDDTVSKPSDSFLSEEHYDIPDHFHLCMECHYLRQRLLRQPHILQQYNSVISEQLNKGIIEAVALPVGKGENFKPKQDQVNKNKAT